MNLQSLFTNDPPFITVNAGGFHLSNQIHQQLHASIEDYIPVRKLFENRTLTCQSIGAVKNRHGRHCSLCSLRYRCRQSIRLMLLIQQKDTPAIPAALDVGNASFPMLQALLERISPDELAETMIQIGLRPDNQSIQLTFEETL